jgi:phosphoenolpyruvate carboxylase
MRALRASGRELAEIERALLRLDVRPVLTAHPTESTRRTLLQLQARVADLLLARDDAPPNERGEIEAALDTEVELLWVTAEVRQDRPTVKDEVSTVLWYLETRLLDAGARARHTLVRAYEEEFEICSEPVRHIVPLRLGNWVGGDRDGNPYVTPDVTLATARRASYAILGRYGEALRDLVSRISVSAALAPPTNDLRVSVEADRAVLPGVFEANQARNADEPLRLKLTFMAARVEATRRLTAARDAGRITHEPAAYSNVGELERDLQLVRDSLVSNGVTRASDTLLDPLIAFVRAHGFHGFLMDVRDHAHMHRSALDDIARQLGVAPFVGEQLRDEL